MPVELGDVYADDQLGCGPGPDTRNREQAAVGRVGFEQRRYRRVEPRAFGDGFGDPLGEQPHGGAFGFDPQPVRPGGGRDRLPERVDGGSVRAPGHRPEGGLAGVQDLPRAAQLGEHPQAVRLGQVDERLEGRTGLQQDGPQPVLVPGRAGHEEVALRRHGAGGVRRGVRLGDGQQRVGDADRRLRDDQRIPFVRLGVTTGRTNLEGVYAAGDVTNNGASIAIEAIGEARRCAQVLNLYLEGLDVPYRPTFRSVKEVNPEDFKDYIKIPRAQMPTRPASERKHDFGEVALGFSEATARAEASRCLDCGCHDYDECKLIQCANLYEIHPERIKGRIHPSFKEKRLLAIERDQGKCILCGLCVRVCEDQAKKGILGLVGRGFNTVVKPEFNDADVIAACRDCKLCAENCPTGALKIL